MTQKHLRRILLVLVIGLALYIPLSLWRDGGSRSEGDPGFRIELGESSPKMIRLFGDPNRDTVRLVRAPDGWTMNGYRADSAKVADLLPALDTARTYDLVGRNPGNHVRLGVADDGRMVQVLTDAGAFTFYLGNRDPAAGGYFVRRADSDSVFRIHGPLGGFLGRSPEAWRVRTIARLDTAAIRELILRRGAEDMVLARGAEDGWKLGEAAANSASVAAILQILNNLTASGFPGDSAVEAADFDAPDATLDVFSEDTSDAIERTLALSLRLLAGPDERGAWLVRPGGGGEVVELSRFQVDRLFPSREDLLPTDEPE